MIVHMPGGELQVEVEDDWNVYMTGDVFYIAKMTLVMNLQRDCVHYKIPGKSCKSCHE